MTRYQVTENNGGGLTLYVWQDNKLVYAHRGYEYNPASLREDIAALKSGDNVEDWDGNDLYDEEIIKAVRPENSGDVGRNGERIPLGEDEYYDDHESTAIICTQDGPVAYDQMGSAGRSVFYPQQKG